MFQHCARQGILQTRQQYSESQKIYQCKSVTDTGQRFFHGEVHSAILHNNVTFFAQTPNTPILKLTHISSWKTYQLLIPSGTRYRGLLPKALTVRSSRWSTSDPTLGRVKVRHPNYCSHSQTKKKEIFQHEKELQGLTWVRYKTDSPHGKCIVQSDVTVVIVRDDHDIHRWQILDRKWDWHKPELNFSLNYAS